MTDESDPTRHVTDEDLRAVIDHYDDPAHPDALDVPDARERLAAVQAEIKASWDVHLAAVRRGDLAVVADHGAVVVLADHTRSAWVRLLDAIDCHDGVERTILRVAHHQAATRLQDRSFDGADPILACKPPESEAGQRFLAAQFDHLLRSGIPAAEAWAHYGVEIRGHSTREWAVRSGRDGSAAVADAVQAARDHLDR